MTYLIKANPPLEAHMATLVARGNLVLTTDVCNCGQCGRMHDSDCAVHNEPAYPKGACTCERIGEETP